MLRLPATPALSSPTASGKANWQKNRRRGSSGKQFSCFARERKCPRKEKKILRANPRTPRQRDLRDSDVPSQAAEHVRARDNSSVMAARIPRCVIGAGTLCVTAFCVVSPSCRLYVASGRASGTRTASRPRVSWSQRKRAEPGQTQTDSPACRLSVVRERVAS